MNHRCMKNKKKKKKEAEVKTVVIPKEVRVYEFAEALKRPMGEIIKVLFDLGIMATKNDFLKSDEIEIQLRRPVCLFGGKNVALSRRIADRWRLIGAGLVG